MKKVSIIPVFVLSILSILCISVDYNKIRISSLGDIYYNSYSPEKGSKHIFKYISKSKSKYIAYTSEPDDCNIDNISMDPSGVRLGIIELCSPNKYHLVVYSLKSLSVLVKLDNGYKFAFSPKGNSIVYSEGIPGERGTPPPPGYKGGIWIYDFSCNKLIQIANDSIGIGDINWSGHDGNIYIGGSGWARRYNVSKEKWEEVPYKGIYFSYDGKYYVSTPWELGTHYLYRTSDNKKMVDWKKEIMGGTGKTCCMMFQFFSKKLNGVVFSISNTENVVFDVGKGKVIGKFYGGVLGTNADGSLVAVNPVKPDNKKAYDQSQVEIINLSEVVSNYQKGK